MKTCFKCKMTLPLTEFYRHPKMGDGHLGKCKTCTKKDVADRVAKKSVTDLQWVLDERERHRLKAERRRRNSGVQPRVAGEGNRVIKHRWRMKNPIKWAAHCIANNAIRSGKLLRQGCEICGAVAHKHHDDYTKPLEVRWLCPAHHAEHHRNERKKRTVQQFQSK